ncbi:hypothetical protein EG328_001791 [Venturia inaequalis]|uniref:Uncharacterized protein n=1 Tax=Venturia inaequalis TaxID=5025 RepID=A0A8H3YZS1_VENIN|nr:hypothetical protein EG328_001791 [Venturia inaequalis]KAE9991451.1 hypothetical protein EG327_011680 [Venturia inaequalis]RDI80813.1 hypothetical protein Vi05172_g9175 [Venturia inaequalis]
MPSITSKTFVGSVVKSGKTVNLYAATRTSAWTRTEEQALEVGKVLKSTLEADPTLIPANTKEMILRESTHKSPADRIEHLTVVCKGDDGDVKTEHIPT